MYCTKYHDLPTHFILIKSTRMFVCVCQSVSKDLINPLTDIVLLYNVGSGSRELFGGKVPPPSKEKLPLNKDPHTN